MDKKIEVLYHKEYVGRLLFALLIDKNITFVYKSSGYSGTGHEGEIIPFMYLNERNTINTPLGYIFKKYYNNNKIKKHNKTFYDKEKEFLDYLKDFLKDFKVKQTIDEINKEIESENFREIVKDINLKLYELSKDYKFFDYNTLNKE